MSVNEVESELAFLEQIGHKRHNLDALFVQPCRYGTMDIALFK